MKRNGWTKRYESNLPVFVVDGPMLDDAVSVGPYAVARMEQQMVRLLFTLSAFRTMRNCLFWCSECVLRCENPFDGFAEMLHRNRCLFFVGSNRVCRFFYCFTIAADECVRHKCIFAWELALKVLNAAALAGCWLRLFRFGCEVGSAKIHTFATIEYNSYGKMRSGGFPMCERTRSQCFARANCVCFTIFLLLWLLRWLQMRYCCSPPPLKTFEPTKIITIIISHTTLICFAGFPY